MFDMISLGEIMLRLDPGDGRIKTARSFKAWEGGGEYNVARGLRRCFGLKTAAVTALADNEVGRLVEDFMLQGGVDTSLIKWVKYDGIGRTVAKETLTGIISSAHSVFAGFTQAEFLPLFPKPHLR